MLAKKLYLVIGWAFAAAAAFHICRLSFGWQFTVFNFTAPVWTSWIGLVLAGILSCVGFTLGLRKP